MKDIMHLGLLWLDHNTLIMIILEKGVVTLEKLYVDFIFVGESNKMPNELKMELRTLHQAEIVR